MSWNNGSYFSGQGGGGNGHYYSSYTDGYGGGGGEHGAAAGGKKLRPPSRLKKAGGKKASDDDYPNSYNVNNHNGTYSREGYNGYGSSPYNKGGGGGYNNGYSSYGNGGDGYTGGGAAIPYNAPAAFWAPQDGTRSPMFISTKEVNVHAMPGSQYDGGYNNDQKRRGGGGSRGFFGPVLEAVGHFFDRKLGFNDRD